MEGKKLRNPPLVEALFEIKWQLQALDSGLQRDPNYGLVVGMLYDKFRTEYPFHERLPTASIPDEMIAGIVQHRFRKGDNQWPTVQVGPGVFTVNDTEGYKWKDFKERAIKGVNTLFQVYPKSDRPVINSLVLRYINAIEFSFDEEDVFEFLSGKMKINISPHPPLFEDTSVVKKPFGIDLKFTFECTKPKAQFNLRIGRGKKHDASALIWELLISSSNEIPKLPSELEDWLKSSHEVIETWFFKLVEGELLERFEPC